MATRIYNGTPSATSINNSAYCNGATALYMLADGIGELEIDCYLQLELTPTTNRLIRLNDSFTLDTVLVFPIPYELQAVDYNIYVAFTTTINQYIEIWAIYSRVTLTDISEQIAELQTSGGIPQETLDFITDSLTTLLSLPVGGGVGGLGGMTGQPLLFLGGF